MVPEHLQRWKSGASGLASAVLVVVRARVDRQGVGTDTGVDADASGKAGGSSAIVCDGPRALVGGSRKDAADDPHVQLRPPHAQEAVSAPGDAVLTESRRPARHAASSRRAPTSSMYARGTQDGSGTSCSSSKTRATRTGSFSHSLPIIRRRFPGHLDILSHSLPDLNGTGYQCHRHFHATCCHFTF
jgi:hypothetical protein